MKGSVFALAALASTSFASLHQHGAAHAQLHQKKDYPVAPAPSSTLEDACTVSWTTWYGEATLVEETSAPSSAPAPASTYAVASPSAATGASFSESTGSASSSSGGSHWAMTYSAYSGSSSTDTSCKTASEVMDDISQFAAKGFSVVRIYATDCNHLPNVGAACKANGLKMIPGIFIDSSGIGQDTSDQLNDIVDYFNGDYSMVEMMVFGNEAIFNGFASGSELASFLSSAKSTLKAAGYTGVVTTSDTVSAIQANAGALCSVIDAVGANIHPFFNGNVEPCDSGSFVDGQFDLLAAACPGKDVYNFETGWPSAGPSYMNAVPSPSNQASAIDSLRASKHVGNTVFFSYQNDGWKNDGVPSVEPYWGCSQLFSG